MNVPFFIARRYFLSKKKSHFISIIAWTAVVGVAFSTGALIIILSVFNGFSSFVHNLHASFDPNIKITAREGKTFEVNDTLLSTIRKTENVIAVNEVIEDHVYIRYRDAAMVAIAKGVSPHFAQQNTMKNYIVEGNISLNQEKGGVALVGRGVQMMLSIDITQTMYPLQVFYVKSLKGLPLNPSHAYQKTNIKVGGIFSVEKNYDEQYIILPLSTMKKISGYDNRRTQLEIKVSSPTKVYGVEKKLEATLGNHFNVLNSEEQKKDLYQLMKIEKLFIFLSLSFVLFISAINIFFSLTMLLLDKKKDIGILAALGANRILVSRIFLLEGFIIALVGVVAGLILGSCICWSQDTFGWVKLGIENTLIKNYPVKMIWTDFIFVGLTSIGITFLIVLYPARMAAKTFRVPR